jgi:hypothetical protein
MENWFLVFTRYGGVSRCIPVYLYVMQVCVRALRSFLWLMYVTDELSARITFNVWIL